MTFIPTCDWFVLAEELRDGYARYRNRAGRRWEVLGRCDGRGDCWAGDASPHPDRDCPVTPEFSGCCPFTFVELAPGDPRELPPVEEAIAPHGWRSVMAELGQ